MKYFVQFCRFAVGILFIFSGLIKLNDPAGTQIKMEEYFEVFAHDFSPFFEHFVPLALPIAIIMCVLEVVLGIALLIQYRMVLTTWLLLGLIVFFSFLTFYSAVFNKVTDCGCFGDAIKLTPWQSFQKDIWLTLAIALLFFCRKRLQPALPERAGSIVVGVSLVLSSLVAYWALAHLPFIDFRPYAVGQNIQANMQLPPNAVKDEYGPQIYTLTNAVSKQVKTMSKDDYMNSKIWEDTTWVFTSSTEAVLLKKGDRPKITDFSVADMDGNLVTDMAFQGNKLIIIVRQTEAANTKCFPEINKLVKDLEAAPAAKVQPMVITSSDGQKFDAFRHEVQLAVPYYFTDDVVLKTISRSNPGIWLLKDGTVKGKWHYNDVPDAATVETLLK
ncbi:MAG: BT_3928 family protein [Bacteroidota bacterium]